MPYNTVNLKTDLSGKPAPQFFSSGDDEYQVIEGSDGAPKVQMADGADVAIGTKADAVAGSDLTQEWTLISIYKAAVTELRRLNGGWASYAFDYAFSTTTTDADPGAGTLRLNHATPASVTSIYVDDTDEDAVDIQAWLRTLDDSTSTVKSTFRVVKKSAPSTFAEYQITAITEATGYFKLTVTYVTGNGSFTNADGVAIGALRTGDKGDTGATGATGTVQAAGDGTVSAPAISFSADTNTGFYRPGADQIGVAVGGAQVGLWTSTGLNGAILGATTPAAITGTTFTATGQATFNRTAVGGSRETIAEFKVSDVAGGYLRIENNHTTNANFAPIIWANQESDAGSFGFLIRATTTAALDTGTIPVFDFDAYRGDTNADLVTRPAYRFRSFSRVYLDISALGNFGVRTTDVEENRTNYNHLQLGTLGFLGFGTAAGVGEDVNFGRNFFQTNSGTNFQYRATDQAAAIVFNASGDVLFRVAASGTLNTDITWTTALTITNAGLWQYSLTDHKIVADTSDGADTKSIWLSGGGTTSASRGAYVAAYGNEHASAGRLVLVGGDVTGGSIKMYTGNVVLRTLWHHSGYCEIYNATTAPVASVTDGFIMYGADITAGNAAAHFRTEGGAVVKLYQQTGIVNADGTLADITTKFNSLLGKLENTGLLAVA